VVGVITRDSIRQALKGGITADQIIGYLKQHAHSQMLQGEAKQPLPPTVVDQIKLWEIERNRLVYSEGVLYSQFLSQVDFNILREYAQSNGHLIWCNKEKRTLIINKSAHDDVKKFWKRYSKGN
jgi:transcription initiation factor TFIIH subunit 4